MTYSLQGNVENYYVARDGKTVTTFEWVFDVILVALKSRACTWC
jgi:hypothetical protein